MTHIGGVQRYWYDANGNMTRRVELSGTQWITFSQGWDTENRLITVTWSGHVVERSFAWAARLRRLAHNFERLSEMLAGSISLLSRS